MTQYRVLACTKCHRLFKSISYTDVCPLCVADTEALFREVKKHLRHHKDATVMDLCEEFEIEEKQVLTWVRQERLYFTKESGVFFKCLECGTSIQTGKYCPSCKMKLTKNIESSIAALKSVQPTKKSSGMHIYKKKK